MGKSKLIFLYMILNGDNYKKYFNSYYNEEKYSKILLKPEYKTFCNNLYSGGKFVRIKDNKLVLSSSWNEIFIERSKDYNLIGFCEQDPYFNNEAIIFKFDKEEEAFYFQLKCDDFKPIGGIQNEKF